MALGCDAENAGDIGDILRTAAAAAGIARDPRCDPMRFGADTVFELATIRGAEAIGMADRIGSLEAGKLADVVVHDATAFNWPPRGDVGAAAGLGHRRPLGPRRRSSTGRSSCATACAPPSTSRRCAANCAMRSSALLQRAGITVPHRWPHLDAH